MVNKFRKLILAASVLVVSLGFSTAGAQEEPSSEAPAAESVMVTTFEYPEPSKAFKISVPVGWETKLDYMGYAVFMEPGEEVREQPSAENPVVADPNVKVAVIRQHEVPVYVDEKGLEDYAREIEVKMTDGIKEPALQIFQKSIQDLPGGRKGLLYYLTDNLQGKEIMMAILVVSTEQFIYRVTLTDYKVSFQRNMEKYFPVMASIEMPGRNPIRPNPLRVVLPVAAVFLAVLGVIFLIRRKRKKDWQELLAFSETSSSGSDPSSMQPGSFSAKIPTSKSPPSIPMSNATSTPPPPPSSKFSEAPKSNAEKRVEKQSEIYFDEP